MAIDTSWDAPHPVGRGTVGAGPRGASVPAEWADRTVLRLDHRRADHHGVLGAGYLAAAVLEVVADRQASWTRAQVAVPSVLVFTTLTLVVTLLHLDRFHLHAADLLTRSLTWAWLLVYAVVPPILTAVWWRQTRTARGGLAPEAPAGRLLSASPSSALPATIRQALGVQGLNPGRSGRPAVRAPRGGGSVLAVAAHRSHGADGGRVARRPRRRSAFDGSIRSRAASKLPVRNCHVTPPRYAPCLTGTYGWSPTLRGGS